MQDKTNQFELIENKIKKLFSGYDGIKYPLYGFGYPEDELFVEINEYDNYVLSYIERGQKNIILVTKEMDELIFSICKSLSFTISNKYERKNRIESIDNRIILFGKHIEILESMKLEDKFINPLKIKYNELLGMRLFV